MHLQSGVALLNQKQYKKAISFFLQFLEKYPDNFDALNLLAVCYVELAELNQAIKILEKAKEVRSNDVKSLMNLGICYAKTSQYQNALPCFEQCDSLAPNHPEILNALGNTYRLLHHYDLAREKLEQALRINSTHGNVKQNLAWLELSESNYKKAESLFLQLLQMQPDNPELLRGLGDCCVKQQRYDEAFRLYSHGLELRPDSIDLLNSIGALYIRQNQPEQGIEFFKRCLKINPEHIDAQLNLGVSLQQQGELNQARWYLESVLKADPYRYEVYFNLVFLCKKKLNQSELESWQDIFDNNYNSKQAYWLAFALGRCLEQQHCYDKSFASYKSGRERLSSIKPYEIKADSLRFDRIKKASYPRKKLLKSSKTFIFITGMPRSGTTLMEQILASHPDVTALGESGIIARLGNKVEELTSRPFYEGVTNLSQMNLNKIQNIFDDWQNNCGTDIVVDTSTGNLPYIGFIMTLFDDVKIVCCKRSPMDTCLSIYRHPLTGENRYANKLFTLASYFKEANKLSNHWSGCFEEDFNEHFYEQLVSSPDIMIPKLLSSLGLTFHKGCLQPEKTRRTVKTPSATAVRDSISTKAIGRWRNYEDQLQELKGELDTHEEIYLRRLSSC